MKTANTLGAKLGVLFFPAAALLQEGSWACSPPSSTCCRRDSGRVRVSPCILARGPGVPPPRSKGIALCVAESEKLSTPVEITADYAYFRLRDEGYTPHDLVRWAQTVAARTATCKDVFVYFKHEESGTGPAFARIFLDALAARARESGG